MAKARLEQPQEAVELNPSVQTTLRFLRFEHGRYVLSTPLAQHPIREFFEIGKGDVLARFDSRLFLVFGDGRFAPIITLPPLVARR